MFIKVIEFIFDHESFWFLMFCAIAIYNLIKLYKRTLVFKSDMEIRNIKYNEDEILGHLNRIIEEALTTYVLYNITSKEIDYINSKLEKDIIEYLCQEVPTRISTVLLKQLALIYNNDYIGDFIGSQIYITVTSYVLEYNKQK